VLFVSQGIAGGIEEFPSVFPQPRPIEVAATIAVSEGRDEGVLVNMKQPALHIDPHAIGKDPSQLLRFEWK
jgi:hypothetical protein